MAHAIGFTCPGFCAPDKQRACSASDATSCLMNLLLAEGAFGPRPTSVPVFPALGACSCPVTQDGASPHKGTRRL